MSKVFIPATGIEKRFAWLSAIPHGSYHEKPLGDAICALTRAAGLEAIQDSLGNVLVRKPAAPPLAPECRDTDAPWQVPGRAPLISSPKSGLIYTASLGKPQKIPLLADADADADCVYWFAGARYLGRSAPDEPLFWQAAPGVTRLTAVDDLGRSSSVRVVTESVP